MNTKHTAGPWHTGRNTVVRNTIVYDATGNAICDCKTFHGEHNESEGSANAKLIAAAPELLEAVKLWQKFFDEMPKGQLGKIVCDIGILNDAFIATSAALKKANT